MRTVGGSRRPADGTDGDAGADGLMAGAEGGGPDDTGGVLFALGAWIDPQDPATIADYDAWEDQIVVVYDPEAGAAPRLSIEPSDTVGAAWVVLNGTRLAEVLEAGSLAPRDVLLLTPAEFAHF